MDGVEENIITMIEIFMKIMIESEEQGEFLAEILSLE